MEITEGTQHHYLGSPLLRAKMVEWLKEYDVLTGLSEPDMWDSTVTEGTDRMIQCIEDFIERECNSVTEKNVLYELSEWLNESIAFFSDWSGNLYTLVHIARENRRNDQIPEVVFALTDVEELYFEYTNIKNIYSNVCKWALSKIGANEAKTLTESLGRAPTTTNLAKALIALYRVWHSYKNAEQLAKSLIEEFGNGTIGSYSKAVSEARSLGDGAPDWAQAIAYLDWKGGETEVIEKLRARTPLPNIPKRTSRR